MNNEIDKKTSEWSIYWVSNTGLSDSGWGSFIRGHNVSSTDLQFLSDSYLAMEGIILELGGWFLPISFVKES